MVTFVKSIKLLVLLIKACLFIIVKGHKDHLSNYTNANESCHNRGGLITQKLLKFDGLINITCDLGVNDGMLKDGESVWVQGQAQTGPYIALHTCMRFSNQDKHRMKTFDSNILYECSVFCDQSLRSIGYLGIYKDSCLCLSDSFRFPDTPECLGNDFMDTQKGIIVFRLTGETLVDVQSKSSNLNCLGASIQENGKTSYYTTKCVSTIYGICYQRVDSDLSEKCFPRQGGFCFHEQNTLLEHYRKCWFYNGTLIPFIVITECLKFPVMLGSFRAFKAIEDVCQNSDIATWSCLSITKYNEIIYLETENCSNGNAFICMDAIFSKSGSETNDGASETSDGASTNIRQLFIIICSILVSVIIMLILLVFWLLYRHHSNKRPRYNNGSSQNDMYITPTPEERFENDATQVAESAAYEDVE